MENNYDYVYDILSSGLCPALMNGGCYFDNGKRFLVWDSSRLVRLSDHLNNSISEKRMFGPAWSLIDSVRMTAAAAEIAWDWLIPQEMLVFSADEIWYDVNGRAVRLKLKPVYSEKIEDIKPYKLFSDLFGELGMLMPGSNAGILSRRLIECENRGSLSFSGIRKLLSRWEAEIC